MATGLLPVPTQEAHAERLAAEREALRRKLANESETVLRERLAEIEENAARIPTEIEIRRSESAQALAESDAAMRRLVEIADTALAAYDEAAEAVAQFRPEYERSFRAARADGCAMPEKVGTLNVRAHADRDLYALITRVRTLGFTW